jgi:putative hydrolase of the HAD superfamily
MIRAILFDATGTLMRLPRGVGWHYRQVAARHGPDLDEARVNAAFYAAFAAAPPRPATGGPRPDDDKPWWRDLVRDILGRCGAEPAGAAFSAMFEELYAHFAEPGVWALYPEAEGVLRELKGRYRLAVVSNFDRRLYAIFDHLGIRDYFDAIIVSSETGADKPDPQIFTAALMALGVSPGETLHVGDDPDLDWRGAEAAGLRAFHLDRPSNSLADLPAYLANL